MASTLASFGLAQSKPAPKSTAAADRNFTVDLVRVQLGAESQWEDLVKKEYLPALKKGGVNLFFILKRATFGEANEYMIFTPINDLSELDQPGAAVKALGEAAFSALVAKFDRITTSFRTIGITGKSELGIPPPSGYQVKLVALAKQSVAPGRTAEFEKYTKDRMKIAAKANVKGILVSRVNSGGDPNEYWISLLVDSFADLGKLGPAFTKAATEAKLAPPPAGVVTHVERSMFQFAPDLSIMPPAQNASQ